MKKLMMASVLGLGCALALGAAAGETKTAVQKTGGATTRVTGCLERGGDASTYKLTHVTGGADWQLIGADASLKMSEHLGHKVEVSGTALGRAPGTKEVSSDDKGVSSGTGSGAKAAVEKKASDDDKGVSSGTGSGARGMKAEKGDHQLKVTSLKHVAPTCP